VDDSNKAFLTNFSVFKQNDLFYNMFDVIQFEKSSFFIIKPNFYKNWHPAIAKIDLSEVIDQIFSDNEGDQ
jgi:arabinogalactan endo-1,4-beta-galactosidase